MGKLTVRKSGRAPKHAGKTPVALDSKSNANPSKQRSRSIFIVQSKRPSKSRVPDEPEVTSEDEEPSKPVKDISLETYTLYKSVMLGDIMVIGDTKNLIIASLRLKPFGSLTEQSRMINAALNIYQDQH